MQRAYNRRRVSKKRRQRPCCDDCGERIVFVKMHTGGHMPAQPSMEMGDGRKSLIVRGADGGHLIPEAGQDVTGRQPHFGNCSPAKDSSKTRHARSR